MRRVDDLAHIEATVGFEPHDNTYWVCVRVDGKDDPHFPPLGPFATDAEARQCLREYGEAMAEGAVPAGDA